MCCRQTFRARPFAVAGAEYTGRGSLLSAGPVSGVLPESGYGCFCTQNSSLCTFFRPWIPFSARKSVSSQHENSKVEMLERIQYALFILLFVLAGSLDGAQVQSGRVVSQPTEFASPLSGRRFRHTIVSRRQSSPATLRSKIPSNRPPRRRSSVCAMMPGPWRRPRAVLPSGLFGLLRPASQAGRLLCLFAGAYPDLAAVPVPVLPHVPG